MRIKKYIAPNMAEAMKQIRKELGADAIILNSKEILQGGFLGMFRKKRIEVIAGIDPNPLPKKTEAKKRENIQMNSSPIIRKGKELISENNVLDEIKQLKKYIEVHSKNAIVGNFPVEYELIYQNLLEQEVNPPLAKDLTDKLLEKYKEENVTNEQLMHELKTIIKTGLQKCTFRGIEYDKKIIQFVGPTGVGKTTTLAKVASNLILNENKSVAFITTDTYRIAAVEQLKTYAQILHAPLEVAYTVEDYKAAINKFKSYDLILVDTAGRNFREERYVKELLKNLDVETDIDTFLVLSLTAKPKDILEIYDQFDHIPIKEVIFTKIDETRQYGSLLNICLEKQIGIAYLTNGQDVPKDIEKANSEKIANLIIGEMNHG